MRYGKDIAIDRVRELLDYDPVNDVLRWKKRPCNRVRVGDVAGRVTDNGYRIISLDGTFYAVARIVWLLAYGEWPKSIIRFVDGDPLNCRPENMRDTIAVTLGLKHDGDGIFTQFEETKQTNRQAYYRNFYLKENFGIDLAEYQRKFIEQKGCCAICEKPETDTYKGKPKWLAVDHCHQSGAIRQLLCTACNSALGLFQDNPEILRKAARYIERHRAPADRTNVLTLVSKETG